MARALANRYGTGVLENVYKTKLKRDYISQQYTVFDQSQFSENYFNFTDLPGVVEPARALVNRIGNVDITPGRILVNRMSGNEDGYEYGDQRAVVSRMIDDGRVVTNRLAADGRILVNRMSNTTPTIPIGSNDARALVNRSNTSRFGEPPPIGGPLPARSIVSRVGQPPPTTQPGVVDQRAVVSRGNSSRLGNQPIVIQPGSVTDARSLVSRGNSSRFGELPPIGGPRELRSLVSRTSGGGIEDGYEQGDQRFIVSRIIGGGIEDGYEAGDGRAIINRMSTEAAPINRISLTAGKNVIKFAANGRCMRYNQPVDFEVLDSRGNPLYTEVANYQDRLGYYYAVIYVYDTTPPGVGTICFVGYASHDQNLNPLPATDKENLAWVALVDIDPYKRNNQDIVFEQSPTVEVSQVLVPYQFNLGTYALASRLTSQSLYGLTLLRSDNAGFDFSNNRTIDILDEASKDNTYNYFGESITTSTIETNIRRYDNDITNGFVYSEYSRYNTILVDNQNRFTKDMEGSIFSFENTNDGLSYTSSYSFTPPYTSSTITPVSNVVSQLDSYKAKIVYVISNKYALLDTPLSVQVFDSRNTINPVRYNQTFRKVSNISGSFIYPTSSLNVISSQNLSSSFIQFTITDLEPIAGDVYRIKTYVKEAGSNTEYKQLNDHIVVPPEYLIDSDKPNQAAYAKNKSDSFVYGEFTDASIADQYWRGFGVEADKNIYQYNYNTTSSYPLANAVVITSKNTLKKGIASRYYQTYIPNQPFSLSFYCTLDPGCELEVYMGSTPLKDGVIGIQGPKAFNESRNMDPTISKAYNKFGKMIGKISNISGSTTKSYDNVVFDFFADADGYGRPVLFLNTNSTIDKNAYVSSISVTPLDLVGYTPTILQFAASVPDSIWILQDDDASLTQSIDLKVEYFNYEGKQSEFSTYIPNVQMNLITEVPGFCSAEAARFNDHCPLYYEASTNGTVNSTVSSIASLLSPSSYVTSDPDSYVRSMIWDIDPPPSTIYFWPTYSLNTSNGFYWNIQNYNVGIKYSSESLSWTTSSNTINSLWRRFDPIMPMYDQVMPGTSPFLQMHSINTISVTQSLGEDGQSFTKTHGAVIQTIDIAKAVDNLQYSSSFTIQQSQAETNNLNNYLKQTRLYFPTNNETYIYGFNENGGIYNVRFKLKRFPQKTKQAGVASLTNNGTPFPVPGVTYEDLGWTGANNQVLDWALAVDINNRYATQDGAKLMVYIHDVASPLLTGSKWQKGTPGFYPPNNNIVTIGNGYGTAPLLRYYDSGSGAYVETFDIILVQYGDRAQLTFDASGIELTLQNNDYYNINHVSSVLPSSPALWGGMISDIEWCKIGTTTDPNFIKPANFRDTFIQKPKRGTWEGGTIIQD